MQNNFKKTMLYFIVAAVAWLPVQVAFAASFVMPASMPPSMQAPMTAAMSNTAPMTTMKQHSAVVTMQADQAMSDMNMAHCDMHKNIKECCQANTACNMSDQECSQCLSFVAMSYFYQLPQFDIQYQTQYNLHQPLTGSLHYSNFRPPRTTQL